jgi:hypothetical protein
VKRRCCCTKRALRTECGMQKGRRCGRTRVFRSAEKFFDRSGLRPVKKNVTLMRVLRPRSKSSFASGIPGRRARVLKLATGQIQTQL